jgi:hypothetical protein
MKFVLELAKGVAGGGHNTSVSLPRNSDPCFLVRVRPCHIASFFKENNTETAHKEFALFFHYHFEVILLCFCHI